MENLIFENAGQNAGHFEDLAAILAVNPKIGELDTPAKIKAACTAAGVKLNSATARVLYCRRDGRELQQYSEVLLRAEKLRAAVLKAVLSVFADDRRRNGIPQGWRPSFKIERDGKEVDMDPASDFYHKVGGRIFGASKGDLDLTALSEAAAAWENGGREEAAAILEAIKTGNLPAPQPKVKQKKGGKKRAALQL